MDNGSRLHSPVGIKFAEGAKKIRSSCDVALAFHQNRFTTGQ